MLSGTDIGAAFSSEIETPRDTTAPGALSKIPKADQALIAAQLGGVLEHLNRLHEAATYLQLAARLESAPASRTALQRRLAAVRAVIKRQAENAARRPIIHEALEQDRTVRPRRVAQAGPPAEKAAPPAKAPAKARRQS